jgi:hypothetical protein
MNNSHLDKKRRCGDASKRRSVYCCTEKHESREWRWYNFLATLFDDDEKQAATRVLPFVDERRKVITRFQKKEPSILGQ